LCAAVSVAVLLFSRELGRARADSTHRMEEVAAHVSFLCGQFEPDTGLAQATAHLSRLSRAAGVERIVVTDTLGMVRWSSNPLLQQGDDSRLFLVDSLAWREALQRNRPVSTPPARIGGEWFASLYAPVRCGEGAAVVAVDVDQAYLAAAQRFRNNVLLLVLTAAGVALALSVVVLRLGRQLNRAQTDSARNERLAFLGQVSAQLAHELKNPLAIIKSSADVLMPQLHDERQRTPARFIAEETMRLTGLINQMLSFSRDTPVSAVSTALAEMLQRHCESRSALAPAFRVAIEVPPEARVEAVPGSVEQIADNLIANAQRAVGPEGRISLRFETNGAAAHLLVQDSGPGVPAAIAGRIFEPFVTGSPSGTGLGLAIVRQLCERNHWRVSLKSASPAIIDICFPRVHGACPSGG
jgi:signal transduction histidine kinase